MPTLLGKAGCAALVKAVGYHSEHRALPERLILQCKRVRDRELFAFFAADVQLPLWQAISRVGEADNALITYIPRRAAAVAEEGVDQGYELARAIGRALEMPVIKTLRNRGHIAQKSLEHADRAENAARSISLKQGGIADAVRGKTVVLVDDITTVGATLAAATKLLLAAGAACVICCTVGMTEEHGTSEGDPTPES
jgi:predicted amidophosphoribosyltransferase